MKIFICNQATDLKTFTDCVYPQGSFCFGRLLKGGDVKVNGVRTHKNQRLASGDEVTYYTTAAQESKPSHAVLYEDNDVVVADKLSGVSCEGLFYELNKTAPYPVHRLDRNTGGVIIIAKTRQAEEMLNTAFRMRTVKKTYLCVAADNFKKPCGTIKAYIRKDEAAGRVTVSDAPAPDALTAVTDFKVLEKRDGLALVEIELHTGRTHQIRASLAHIGCPVLGDTRYGDFALNRRHNKTRQQLLSARLEFACDFPLKSISGKQFKTAQSLDW